MAQLAEIATGDTAASASVPYREVSAQEWMQVPRTLPDSIVILGTWGPLLALLIWLFRIQGAEVPAAGSGWWSLLLGLVAVIALGYTAGRLAPWFALAVSVVLLYRVAEQIGIEHTVLLAACAYFALLAMGAAISGLRFSLQLRRWRLEAHHRTVVSLDELSRCSAHRQVSRTVRNLAVGAIGFGTFRLGLDFFTDAQQDWSRLDRSDLETLVFGVAGLALWGVLLAVKAATANFVGVIALRVPASPTVPNPIRYGALSGVVSRVEAAAEDCSCLKNPHNPGDEDDAFMGKFVRVDDLCAVHGIEAVNALPPAEFARVAAQPWIWGRHVNDGLVPVRATVLLLGLYGWGSRPVPVWDEQTRTAGGARRANNIYPHRVSEVLDRSRRRLRWRGAADTGLEPVSFVGETGDVLDTIPLSSVGLNGHAVRVAGERPYLKPA